MITELLQKYAYPRLALPEVNYRDLQIFLEKLDPIGGVEVSVIGESDGIVFEGLDFLTYRGKRDDVGKRNIYAIDIQPRISKKGQFFITAGHHPVEPAGPAAAIEFVDELLRSNSTAARNLRDHYQVTIVPMVDVDYFSLPSRRRIYTTSNNFYHRLDSEEFDPDGRTAVGAGPEAKAVAKLFQERTKDNRAFTFDLHESWYESKYEPRSGFYIFQYEDTGKKRFASRGVEAVKKADIPTDGEITEQDVNNIRRDHDGLFTGYAERLGHCGIIQESVTSIRGKKVPLESRVKMHLTSMSAIIPEVIDSDYFLAGRA